MARKKTARKLIAKPRWDTNRRAILLDRVSDDRDRGHEIIAARERMTDIRNLAAAKRLEILEERIEMGVSGDHHRDAMDDALEMVRSGTVGWLVVHGVDRLTREGVASVGEVLDVLDEHGCALLIHSPLVDSTSEGGRLVIDVMAALALMERRRIAKWWAKSQDAAWRHGIYPGDLPCGLRNPVSGEIPAEPGHPIPQHIPDEVAVIRQVANALVDDGISWPLAAQMMTTGIGHGGRKFKDEDGKPRWAAAWSPKGVQALFGNRMLLGELSFGDRPPKRDAFEPILTASQFEAINGRRTTSETARQNKPKYTGAGTLRCGSCRHALHHRTSGKGERTYFCRNGQCQDRVRNLDAASAEALLEHYAFEAHEHELELLQAGGEGEGARTVGEVDTLLSDARTRKRQFALLLADDPEDQDMRDGHERIKAAISELEAERRALENALGGKRAGFLFSEVWETLEPWERIEHIRSVLEVVFVATDGTFYPFEHGVYPHPLPSKGRSVPLRRFDPADMPHEVGATAPAGA